MNFFLLFLQKKPLFLNSKKDKQIAFLYLKIKHLYLGNNKYMEAHIPQKIIIIKSKASEHMVVG